MKKLLLILTLLFPLLVATSCGGDNDEPEVPKLVPDAEVSWLKANIEGEWFANKLYNGISGQWTSTSLGYSKNKFVFTGSELTISDFSKLNGVHSYSLKTEPTLQIIIDGDAYTITSVDVSNKQVTIANLAKLEKR